MLRGLYAAASGMLARGIWQDAIANNLANLTTPGFKRDFPVFKSFAEILISRITDIVPDRASLKSAGLMHLNHRERVPVGVLGMGTDFEGIATNLSQGPLVETGNSLDLAIDGDGFFVVQTPSGERYTRSGSFSLDDLGRLATQEGFTVMGENGPITLPTYGPQAIKGIEVTETGAILVSGRPVAQLRIVRFQNPAEVVKEGNGLFRLAQGPGGAQIQPQPAGFSLMVKQGFLEMSNSNPITELVSMIECLRAYETNQKAIAFFDQTLEKAVNEVGRG